MALYKILKYLAAVVGAAGVALFIWLISVGPDAVTNSAELQASILNPFFYLTYFIFGLVILSVLVFVVIRLASGNIKEILYSVGGFLLIFIISYLAADGTAVELSGGLSMGATASKWLDTGLNMLYILIVVAVLSLFMSSVRKLTFRK